MYIAPNSTVILCKGLKIDSSYTDTIYFDTPSAQEKYFSSKAVYTLNNNSYIRKGFGRIRVGIEIGALFDCNYLMYKNTGISGGSEHFEGKWIYAFITSTEYVNNQTTDVYFTVDVLQTWMFDYKLNQCFVEREHSSTDIPGDNLIDEGLETGDFLYVTGNDLFHDLFNGPFDIVVATTLNRSGGSSEGDFNPSDSSTWLGSMQGGVFTGLHFHRFNADNEGVRAVSILLDNASKLGKEDGIVSIFMCPHDLADSDGLVQRMSDYKYSRPSDIKGYTPRNKKLLTAPYVGLLLTNNQGTTASFKYENFDNPTAAEFICLGSLGCAPEMMCIPLNYCMNDGSHIRKVRWDFGIALSGFPQCAWATDSYRAWLAKNNPFLSIQEDEISNNLRGTLGNIGYAGQLDKLSTEKGNIDSITNTVQSAARATGNSIGAVLSGKPSNVAGAIGNDVAVGMQIAQTAYDVSTNNRLYDLREQQRTLNQGVANRSAQLAVQNIMAQRTVASLTPPQSHGVSVGNVKIPAQQFRFEVYQYTIKPQFAKRIDNYWDMYGYETKEIKVPNRNVRPHWCYTRTSDCNFRGSVPDTDMVSIRGLYNGGIRWWKNGDEIGRYDLNNSV